MKAPLSGLFSKLSSVHCCPMFLKDSECSPWPITHFTIKCKKTVERGRDLGRLKRVKGVKYTVMKGDQTVGEEHTVRYTDNVS